MAPQADSHSMPCKCISSSSIYFCATSVPLKHMAPHLTLAEQDTLMEWRQKFTPIQIHYKLQRLRARRNIACPDLTAVRKFLKGKTHRRGAIETRGAKSKWTRAHVLAANRERRKRIKACKGTKFNKCDKSMHRWTDSGQTCIANRALTGGRFRRDPTTMRDL